MAWEIVMGLEVHVELNTKTKIFCSCTTAFGGEPNTHCCPVCTGQPGSLPVLNKQVLEYAVKTGIALNCDIILAADNAKFGQPELSLASIPCFGATQLLTKAIGKAKAMEVILSGRAINAEEAERTGLVSRIIPLTDLYDECYKVAAKIAEQSDLAVSTAKQAIKQAAANTPLATGIALENQSSRMCLNSEDFRESLADFIRKHS